MNVGLRDCRLLPGRKGVDVTRRDLPSETLVMKGLVEEKKWAKEELIMRSVGRQQARRTTAEHGLPADVDIA